MSGMFERVLYDVLYAGREEATENSDFLVEFLCTLGLSEDEAEEVRTYWDGITIPNPKDPSSPFKGVDIIHQYPRGPNTKFPCWAIVLMGEGEGTERGERFIGDEEDDCFDDDGNFVGEATGSIWKSTYGIFTYAQHPDLCLYYYELLRYFLTSARGYLKEGSGGRVLDSAFSGADMIPDPRYTPENMFTRIFKIEVKRDQSVISRTPRPRGTKISGPFVAPNPESQITDVNPGVTVYIPEEGE